MTFEVVTNDRIRIVLDVYQHVGQQQAVVICPGFFQSKETATFQRLSRALAQDRDVLAMDFRGHGRSGGLYTFSAREGADLEAVLQWARPRYAAIDVLAFSLGAAIAINTLSRDRAQIRSLVAVSAPSSFDEIEFKFWTPEAIRTGLQGTEPGSGCRPGHVFLQKTRPIDSIRTLEGLPTLLIHGTRDMIVGVQHSHRLHAAAPFAQLQVIEGGSHAEALFRDAPDAFHQRVTNWWRAVDPARAH